MKATLGRTEITVDKDGFGCLPLQRIEKQQAISLLRQGYEAGITFFDTARAYTDSEEKLGQALAPMRKNVIIATKTLAKTAEEFRQDLQTSLDYLQTDYVDIYQFHMPSFCPMPGDGTGLYEEMEKAKSQGKIRFIGITNHKRNVALQAVQSGLYDTLQFQFNYLVSRQDIELVELCHKNGMGFIAMKALAGGLITDVSASRSWLAQYSYAVPIWGMQRQSELDALLKARDTAPILTPKQQAQIETDRTQLAANFCRGCGYCMPCPVGIQINNCARMSLLLRRAPAAGFFSPQWQQEMAKISDCIDCGQCKAQCPYELNTPELLQKNHKDYLQLLAENI